MKEAQHGFHEDAVEFVHPTAGFLEKPTTVSKPFALVLAACAVLVVATFAVAVWVDGVTWPLAPAQYPPFIALAALVCVIVCGFVWLRRD